jgi:hypothetical protein
MLDMHSGQVLEVLVTRHTQLVREQQMHRLATEVRSAARGGEQRVRRRRRVFARRVVPAT